MNRRCLPGESLYESARESTKPHSTYHHKRNRRRRDLSPSSTTHKHLFLNPARPRVKHAQKHLIILYLARVLPVRDLAALHDRSATVPISSHGTKRHKHSQEYPPQRPFNRS